MDYRFPVLSFISIALRIIGWLIVLGGLCLAGYEAIIVPNQSGNNFDLMGMVIGAALMLFGLLGAACGEMAGVLFAIEENTRLFVKQNTNLNNQIKTNKIELEEHQKTGGDKILWQ